MSNDSSVSVAKQDSFPLGGISQNSKAVGAILVVLSGLFLETEIFRDGISRHTANKKRADRRHGTPYPPARFSARPRKKKGGSYGGKDGSS